jgi:orotidine-5'-phosphate decarboxylase
MHFGDRLIMSIRKAGHPLCVGLDPHLSQIPKIFAAGEMEPWLPETADSVHTFFSTVLDRMDGRVPVIKPQIAFFEQMGSAGIAVLEKLVSRAREDGILVIMDAKRGDIGSTATAYARSFLVEDAPLKSDALTINPYLGMDTLEPFVEAATENSGGVFILVKTSNAGSADFQNLKVDNRMLYQTVADKVCEVAGKYKGRETGWSCVGVVAGATYPEEAIDIRERMPESLILIPGYGAQGGSAKQALQSFVPGPEGLEGGIVNSSRGILFPNGAYDASRLDWERLFDDALNKAIDQLGDVMQG